MKFHYRHQLTDLVMKYETGQKMAYDVWEEESNCVLGECLQHFSVTYEGALSNI